MVGDPDETEESPADRGPAVPHDFVHKQKADAAQAAA